MSFSPSQDQGFFQTPRDEKREKNVVLLQSQSFFNLKIIHFGII